jgi:hypothetical protein
MKLGKSITMKLLNWGEHTQYEGVREHTHCEVVREHTQW